jgi:7-cyano-7-deazaguanine synthase
MSESLSDKTIGLLLSGGLDSSILLGHLLYQQRRVLPFYIRSQLAWQREELKAAKRFLRAVATDRLEDLVVLDLPVRDVYGDHWSITGKNVPGVKSSADAVYLPGRNALLLIKAALWCHLHGIDRLALAVLESNPFSDATPEFFSSLESTLERATGDRIRFVRPFAKVDKADVMCLGRGLPLELTFSCIAPVDGLHCGRCNKCAERQNAFCTIGGQDKTKYANR